MKLKSPLAAVVAILALSGPATAAAATDEPSGGEKAATAVRDAWIDGKLETALLFNERLNPFVIGTDVEDGVVTLTGSVKSEIDRELAGEIAASIDGVKDVRNELELDVAAGDSENERQAQNRNFRQRVADATLTARVKSQLLAHSDTDGLAVDVDTEDGVVTLSGAVPTAEEKELMARLAANASGVQGVTNNLQVEPEEAEE